ncbi:MAG: molecular chaperone DnaJ [Rhodospirillaceae bacterium]|nr:MAG: molecular chaperone DnaJ [Rhodospirillaceae bacterium]
MPRKSATTRTSEGTGQRTCDRADCLAEGCYRAPRSRENLRHYYWFCLAHVREYNRAWNFYAGLTESEVEAITRHDTVWQRPSWPFGENHARRFHNPDKMRNKVHDAFYFFKEETMARPGPASPETEEEKAFRVLELTPPTTLEKLKERYKTLAKRHHPDIHGGDKAGEDRLKEINLAYQMLVSAHGS